MAPDAPTSVGDAVERALDTFLADLVAALPDVLAGLLFLVVAALLVKLAMVAVRWLLDGLLPGESTVYRQFVATIVAVFLWFGVALSFLGIVGLEAVAAALGTASGFLALGVSYALSGMLADAVAGVYLLRDPDFDPGDTVTVGSMTGDVATIELRKTRFRVDGDTVVRANAEIEKQWTKEGDPAPGDAAT
jgi:small-conductance mechanosensitive channel